MTTQAIIAGKGLSSFSETRNVASGSGISSDSKKTSFDNFMSSGKSDNDYKVYSDNKESSKTFVNKIGKYDNVTANKSSIDSREVNKLDINVVDGEICVTCPGSLESEAVDFDEFMEMLKEFFSDKLGISKEELEKMLAENGISVAGLLQMDNLQMIFTQVNGIDDFSQLLTDEELSGAWNELLEKVNTANIEFGNMGVVDMSKLQELFENDDVVETINAKLLLNEGRVENKTEESDVVNNIINDNQVAINDTTDDMTKDNMTQQDMTSKLADEANAKSDKNSVSSFNESLFETFIKNIQEGMNELQTFDRSQISQIRDVAMQIIEGVKFNVKAETSSLELQLNPEALGKVQVAIEVKDGIATASFLVKDEMVKAAVESQLQVLKDSFEENGLKVDKVEVSVSDFSFENSNQTFSQEKDDKSSKKSTSGNDMGISGTASLNVDNSEEESVDNSESLIDVKA